MGLQGVTGKTNVMRLRDATAHLTSAQSSNFYRLVHRVLQLEQQLLQPCQQRQQYVRNGTPRRCWHTGSTRCAVSKPIVLDQMRALQSQ